jgi:hypothetical protein
LLLAGGGTANSESPGKKLEEGFVSQSHPEGQPPAVLATFVLGTTGSQAAA